MNRTGLLLINLGTPESPAPRDVRPYLREFLMDPRVLDVPFVKRWPLVNLIIAPFRAKPSGEAYEAIWTEAGSPLLNISRELTHKVSQRLGDDVVVELAMRYGEPSIPKALQSLRERSVDRLVVFPLYPQYSSAATGSSIDRVYEITAKMWNTPYLQVVPSFYDHPAFIESAAAPARKVIDRVKPEKVFFSFHGVPERHCTKSDDTGRHCLEVADCCDRIIEANRNCYRAHCIATARALGDTLGLPQDQRVICFQSRLGKTPWIKPYTDVVLEEEARRGTKRAVILSPAFVADCLETIEELGIRGLETWREHGGEELALVPCVNADDRWADAVVQIAREQTTWLDEASTADGARAAGGG